MWANHRRRNLLIYNFITNKSIEALHGVYKKYVKGKPPGDELEQILLEEIIWNINANLAEDKRLQIRQLPHREREIADNRKLLNFAVDI